MAEVRMDRDHLRALMLAFGEECYRAGYAKAHGIAKDHAPTPVASVDHRTRSLMATLARWDPTVENDDNAKPAVWRALTRLDARQVLREHELAKVRNLSDGFPGGFPSDWMVEAYLNADAPEPAGGDAL